MHRRCGGVAPVPGIHPSPSRATLPATRRQSTSPSTRAVPAGGEWGVDLPRGRGRRGGALHHWPAPRPGAQVGSVGRLKGGKGMADEGGGGSGEEGLESRGRPHAV